MEWFPWQSADQKVPHVLIFCKETFYCIPNIECHQQRWNNSKQKNNLGAFLFELYTYALFCYPGAPQWPKPVLKIPYEWVFSLVGSHLLMCISRSNFDANANYQA